MARPSVSASLFVSIVAAVFLVLSFAASVLAGTPTGGCGGG